MTKMARFIAFQVLTLLLLISQVSCYSVRTVERRSLLQKASFLAVSLAAPPHANAVLSSGFCAQGVGEGCEDRSEGNEFMKSLQEKSAANREANTREALNAYWVKNYPDAFASTGKTMVKKQDGTFAIFSNAEMDELRKNNKIGVEIPTAKGGKYQDLTQKRILILKE
jgi:hypothetical protein